MPDHHHVRRAAALAVSALLLAGCAGPGSAAAPAGPAAPAPEVDPAGRAAPDTAAPADLADGPHEVRLVADFGPLPDFSGDAVVETIWTTDGSGTRSLVIDTPAGITEQHVMTEDEHWWWLSPEVRETIADAEWIHFDLAAIEAVGGELPPLVADARAAARQPGDIAVGDTIAGLEVLAADVVSDDEVHLTMSEVERAVVHRRRALPPGTRIELPVGAVDVADLADVLRW